MKYVSFIIELKDKISATLKKMGAAFDDVSREVKAAQSQTQKFQDVCSKLNMPNLNAMVQVAERLGGLFASAADTGMSFGQSMADLSSITGIAGEELAQLEENSRRLGKESGLGADTAARAYSLLASNIEISKIGIEGLNKLEERSITLAHASGMSLDGAAEALAGTINQFGLGADAADRVINILAAGSKYGAAEIEHLSQSFKVVGAAASAMGLDVESTAGALEVLSQANLKGSEAGTALRNIILKLNTELGIDLGETSLGTALEALKPKLSDAAYLSKVFGMENIAAAQFLIQNAAAVDEMTAKLTGTSVAEEQAAIRTETTAQKMQQLRASVDDIKIGFTDMLGSLAPFTTLAMENAEALALMGTMAKGLYSGMGTLNQMVVKLTGSTILQNVATKAASAATAVWSGIQKAFNLVLTANPIGLVVAAIGALVAGVIYAYNHFEGFRNVCDKVWGAVKAVASAVWDYLVDAFEKASAVIKKAWEWVKKFFGIKDDASAKEAAATLDKQTKSIEANTEAKKKNNAVVIDFDATGGNTTSQKDAPVFRENASTLGAIQENVQALTNKLQNATIEQAASINQQIAKWQEMADAIENAGKVVKDDSPVLDEQATTLEGIEENIQALTNDLQTATVEQAALINQQIAKWQEMAGVIRNAGKNVPPADISQLDTISELDAAISHYSSQQKSASASEIVNIQRTIDALEQKRKMLNGLKSIPSMQSEIDALDSLTGNALQMKLEVIGLDEIREKIKSLQNLLNNTNNPLGEDQKKEVESLIGSWKKYETVLVGTHKQGDLISGAMSNLSSLMGSLSGVVGEGAGGWVSYGANILSAVAQAMPALASVIGGNIAQAFSGAAAQSQTVPFPYNLIALAASMAAVGAAVASIPKFADGGIAYGPTLGIFGEYAGASHNPEVVAPLDRLKSIIGADANSGTGSVEFKIKGETLVGVLNRRTKHISRT